MLGHQNTRSSLSESDALSIGNTCHFLALSGLLMTGFISVYVYIWACSIFFHGSSECYIDLSLFINKNITCQSISIDTNANKKL